MVAQSLSCNYAAWFSKGASMRNSLLAFLCCTSFSMLLAQPQPQPKPQDFVKVQAPVIALEHVRVIDGTGAAAKADQTVIIADGKITSIGDAASAKVPDGANRMDLNGR